MWIRFSVRTLLDSPKLDMNQSRLFGQMGELTVSAQQVGVFNSAVIHEILFRKCSTKSN